MKRWGVLVEGQYWFTNQWFINAAYGMSPGDGYRSIEHNIRIEAVRTILTPDLTYQMRTIQQVDATLWYRPIAALKFGLQYSYLHAQFLADAYPGIVRVSCSL